MNARAAKAIRRRIYGKGHHPGPVIYRWEQFLTSVTKRMIRRLAADPARRAYQAAKRFTKNAKPKTQNGT